MPRWPRKVTLDERRPDHRALQYLRGEDPKWKYVLVSSCRYLDHESGRVECAPGAYAGPALTADATADVVAADTLAYVLSAVESAGHSAEQKARDLNRKPAEVLSRTSECQIWTGGLQHTLKLPRDVDSVDHMVST